MEYLPTTSFTYEQLSEWKERELIEQILELQNAINNYIDYEASEELDFEQAIRKI
tara:strand:- start:82 stop:246 length:165 start_codon:yes stop_codon:yes gene_type:complete